MGKVKAKELPPSKLKWRCPHESFKFKTTKDIEPYTNIIGQDRALDAIKMGLDIEHRGFNVFITGMVGTGRTTTIKRLLEQLEKNDSLPNDICYMNNFKNSSIPRCIELPAGKGSQLSDDMNKLIKNVRDNIRAVFQSEYYKERHKKLVERIRSKQKKKISEFEEKIKKEGLALVSVQVGSMVRPQLVPLIDGKPADATQISKLLEERKVSEEYLNELKDKSHELSGEMAEVYEEVKKLEEELSNKLEELNVDMIQPMVDELIEKIDRRYQNKSLSRTLEEVKQNIMAKLDLFRRKDNEGDENSGPLRIVGLPKQEQDPYREFRVNVVVDNSERETPPVIIENFPNLKNIFGIIEREYTVGGWSKVDHMSLRAGSLHRANGGYLVLNALDVFLEPGVWTTLKRTLKSSESIIQTYDPYGLATTSALKPEPITVNVKIVMIGASYLYNVLQTLDEDFKKIFKIRADFDREVDRRASVISQYAGFIRLLGDRENLKPFDKSAVAEVVEYGVRLAGRKNKLSTRFSEIADIVREAEYHADSKGSNVVNRKHVKEALDQHIHRVSLIEDKIQERIDDGTLMIDTAGEVVGQVNALTVYKTGDYTFGRPARITARTSLGNSGVINIEREADLSGRTHNKGVLILSGYLNGKYGDDTPIVMNASLCFEQSYAGVDGDSASSTELYAILSSLADLPIRQDLAVTGSINQKGEIQPIGAVNEKIEGFFKVCKSRELKGTEGVIIPGRNVSDLMVSEEVIDAVEKNRFHIYSIDDVDKGIYLLTGVQAGRKHKDGSFTRDSVHDRVKRRLVELAQRWGEFGRKGLSQ
jgi:lon-related putative ATP-dependent protease